MGVKLDNSLGVFLENTSKEFAVSPLIVESVIKEYIQLLTDGIMNRKRVMLDNIMSIEVLMTEKETYVVRGRVSNALKNRVCLNYDKDEISDEEFKKFYKDYNYAISDRLALSLTLVRGIILKYLNHLLVTLKETNSFSIPTVASVKLTDSGVRGKVDPVLRRKLRLTYGVA